MRRCWVSPRDDDPACWLTRMHACMHAEIAHPPPGITSPKAGKTHHTETEDDAACGQLLAEAGFKPEGIVKTGAP